MTEGVISNRDTILCLCYRPFLRSQPTSTVSHTMGGRPYLRPFLYQIPLLFTETTPRSTQTPSIGLPLCFILHRLGVLHLELLLNQVTKEFYSMEKWLGTETWRRRRGEHSRMLNQEESGGVGEKKRMKTLEIIS